MHTHAASPRGDAIVAYIASSFFLASLQKYNRQARSKKKKKKKKKKKREERREKRKEKDMANNDNNGKRKLEEDYGDDDISGARTVDIGSLYDTTPDVTDEEMCEMGEELDPEILNDTPRCETYMQTLENQLNWNESFDAEDEFQVDMTVIAKPDAGGRTSLSILGKLKMTTVLRHKRCVVPIKNTQDDLCLARVIWLTKAHLHKDDDKEGYNYYKNLRQNPLTLTRCAKYLHRKAGVPEGPCGREELKKFQEYLASDYRLKVMSFNYPYRISFEGTVPAPTTIRLLFESDPKLRVIKDSAKPLGVTKDLEEYPARACVVLDELLCCVDERAKMTDLEKIRTRITHSVLDAAADTSDDEKQFRKVYNIVMLAFDEFVCYWEDKPLPRDSSDYNTSDNDQDR
ncbi:hypothetical protein AWC38_SpisGene19052 [Stylophora pistillata]|uniref:Uncharacterized protein n=1 Tax=Stylophora pistillata TaxID=50429 RepID=A0A2B4RJX4_STYPI|nr:hypothetical protein AWC38_SpisGene19052 [Stylophora pistillata]